MRHHFVAAALLLATAAAADPVRVAGPYMLHRDIRPGDDYMGVQFQGALKLDAVRVDGHVVGGLSALAHDADEGILYALSDNGVVFQMILHHDESGFLNNLEIVRAFPLKNGRGRPLKGKRADSEGLTLRYADNGKGGDTELVVSFERLPRVLRFSTQGDFVGAVGLPQRLRNTRLYQSANRGLESLAWHPRHGYLVAMEQPFKDASGRIVELHALNGRFWRYPLANEPNAGLTEALVLKDGSLLTLERGFGLFFVPVISSLRRVREFPATEGALLTVDTVARFNTGQGWALDNFEGLALLDGDRVVMVSDDNRRALQVTLLAQFRLLPSPPAAEDEQSPGAANEDGKKNGDRAPGS